MSGTYPIALHTMLSGWLLSGWFPRSVLLHGLASCIYARFKQTGNQQDLDWYIALTRLLIDILPPDFPIRRMEVDILAAARSLRYDRWKCRADLDREIVLRKYVIELQREDEDLELWCTALILLSECHLDYPNSLHDTAISQFQKTGNTDDLGESSTLLSFRPEGHADRGPGPSFFKLANALCARFKQNGDEDDLNDAIRLYRDALDCLPTGHPDCPLSLGNLGSTLSMRFNIRREADDLNESINLSRAALALLPDRHPDRPGFLNNLGSSLCMRSKQNGSTDGLNEGVQLLRTALSLFPEGHPGRSASLENLANSLDTRFEQTGSIDDLDEAVILHRDTLPLHPEGHPDRSVSLNSLADCLTTRFEQTGSVDDLNEAVRLHHEALSLRPEGHPNRALSLNNLAKSLQTRFQQTGSSGDLNEAVRLYRDALALRPEEDPDKSLSLDNLASSLRIRFDQSGSVDDLNESVQLHCDALSLRPEGHRSRPMSLNHLAISLRARFEQSGSLNDLDEAIRLHRDALFLCPEGHSYRALSLNNLASGLTTRFEQTGSTDDLNEAVELNREALVLFPEGNLFRSSSLNDLGISLTTRFEQTGSIDDLNEAIRVYHDSLSLQPEGHPGRPMSLNNLANSLCARFQQIGNLADLDEAVRLHRDALALRPEGPSHRSLCLDGLAGSLCTRFEWRGNMDDLNEAVRLYRDALSLCPEGGPGRPRSLNNLSNALWTRFEQGGSMDDLNEMVRLCREALSLWPERHTYRSISLGTLASTLQTRFKHNGSVDDLNEAIRLHRAALSLHPEGHFYRSASLDNLAGCLKKRFVWSKNADDLNEAIRLHYDALSLRPEGHAERPLSLNNLANGLRMRFMLIGSIDDLNEAVRLHRGALSLRPEGHPARCQSLNNLADSLQRRFEGSGDMDDLNEAISLHRDALALLPVGRPSRSLSMYNIASALHARFQKLNHSEDFEECLQQLMGAAAHTFSPTHVRLAAAYLWSEYARRRDHTTTLDAYRTTISLLQRALMASPSLSERHEVLLKEEQYRMLGVDAASYAIEKGDLGAAIELLEKGRALIWSQMRGLRAPLDLLSAVDQGLADRFSKCCRELETLVTSLETGWDVLDMSGDCVDKRGAPKRRHPRDEMLERIRQLSEEHEAIINEIRLVPGFEDFLRIPSFEQLRQAATEGPIIILNHSRFRCDALIILSQEVKPCVCVPLDGDWFSDATNLCNDLFRARYEHEVHSLQFDETLRRAMKVVWDRVVSKVVKKLEELGIAKGSRIWWCPTLFLSALPFHAAGPYKDADGVTKYLLDDYISSYAPTLTSLTAARSGICIGSEKFLFVGDTSLKATKRELNEIRSLRRVGKILLDNKASRDKVLAALQDREWVHFACHGSINQERPFESSLVLPGGKLTLLDITKANPPNAAFAFLSACHTAEQPARSALDEALNLAAAIQFCGFRSVVGTMWQLLDRDAPLLSKAVYMHLMTDLGEGEIRFKRAAAAVREASLYLRSRTDLAFDDEDVKAWRWVNLVHIGA